MKRRTFVQSTAAFAASASLGSLWSCAGETETQSTLKVKNWAGNLTYSTGNVSHPESIAELQQLIREQEKLRALGTQHCFNTIADSKHALLSQLKRQKTISIDKEKIQVQIEAGTRYGDFCKAITEEGFALKNLASLPHISAAGAAATSTHGSGVNNGSLATEIAAYEIIKADGDIVKISKETDPETFNALAVHLGCFGVISTVTLDLVPAYEVEQRVYRNLPMDALETHFDEIMGAGYSVSLFTDWQNQNINQVWIKSRTDEAAIMQDPEFFGAKLAEKNMHPIDTESSENCTDQMGVAGPWYDRLPHFKMDFMPSKGDELQAEFFVPYEDAYKAIRVLERMHADIAPHLFITEIRSIAEDSIWMSPFNGQKSIAIHFTLKPHKEVQTTLLPKIEAALQPFNVKPHWGKLFTMAPKTLQSKYNRLNDFKALVAEYDPKGKFRNEFIDKNLYS
ncbi:D-arabinono-1,4-lactone oxidase [Jiulongibacter sp. NS-SX5]|uniref:D-arabinono-1,4-lactone oxidase n=1 Tax=Jiulongibacter sp. NS-SX5 TaxID=3463854 RepID=UPI004058BB34